MNLTYNPYGAIEYVVEPCIEVASKSNILFLSSVIIITLLLLMFINAKGIENNMIGSIRVYELMYILISTSIVCLVIIIFSII